MKTYNDDEYDPDEEDGGTDPYYETPTEPVDNTLIPSKVIEWFKNNPPVLNDEGYVNWEYVRKMQKYTGLYSMIDYPDCDEILIRISDDEYAVVYRDWNEDEIDRYTINIKTGLYS